MNTRGIWLGCLCLVAVLLLAGCGRQTPEELFVKGCKAFEGGDVIGAALYFNKFLENFPEHEYAAKAHLMLARTRARSGDEALAIKEYRMLTRKFPDTPEAVNASFELAEYYTYTERPAEVEKELRALQERTQDNRIKTRALFEMAGAYIANATNPEHAESLLREVFDITADDETRLSAYFGMAEAYIRSATEPERTEQILRDAMDIATRPEERNEALFRMGHAYVSCAAYEDAIRIYNEIIHDASIEEDGKAMAYLFLSKSYKADGEIPNALESLERLRQEIGASDVAVWSGVESALLVRESTPELFEAFRDQTIQSYQEIVDASPTSDRAAWAQTKIAEAYREVGDATAAIHAYGRVIDEFSNMPDYVDRSRQMIRILRQQMEEAPAIEPIPENIEN